MSKVIQSMFYNANYNLGYPDGQSKFIWGVQKIDFSKDIQKQLVGDQEVFNFNLTSLNPIFDPYHDENKLSEENQRLTAIATKHAARADELYEFVEKVANAKVCNKEISGQFGGVEEISYISDIFADRAKELIEKSRIEAEQDDA